MYVLYFFLWFKEMCIFVFVNKYVYFIILKRCIIVKYMVIKSIKCIFVKFIEVVDV